MSVLRFAHANRLQASGLIPPWRRVAVLRMFGMAVAKGVIVREGCFFGSAGIRVGAGCFINHQCYFDGKDDIVLEEWVHLAPRVQILTATHDIGASACRAGADRSAPVTIGRGSWIGANATVLPGVAIAPGCVIAAGAVVAADTRPDGLYAGVPARRTRDLSDGP